MTTAVWRPPPRSLADVRDPDGADCYPRHLLEGCESALVLFAAAWHGRQDAYWLAEAGLTGTCVDTDRHQLGEMAAVYPNGWQFVQADAFDFAADNTLNNWDVVSLDPFTNLFDECARRLPVWATLARKLIILGTGHDTKVRAPSGWRVLDVRKRSDFGGGVFWTCLEPVAA